MRGLPARLALKPLQGAKGDWDGWGQAGLDPVAGRDPLEVRGPTASPLKYRVAPLPPSPQPRECQVPS